MKIIIYIGLMFLAYSCGNTEMIEPIKNEKKKYIDSKFIEKELNSLLRFELNCDEINIEVDTTIFNSLVSLEYLDTHAKFLLDNKKDKSLLNKKYFYSNVEFNNYSNFSKDNNSCNVVFTGFLCSIDDLIQYVEVFIPSKKCFYRIITRREDVNGKWELLAFGTSSLGVETLDLESQIHSQKQKSK